MKSKTMASTKAKVDAEVETFVEENYETIVRLLAKKQAKHQRALARPSLRLLLAERFAKYYIGAEDYVAWDAEGGVGGWIHRPSARAARANGATRVHATRYRSPSDGESYPILTKEDALRARATLSFGCDERPVRVCKSMGAIHMLTTISNATPQTVDALEDWWHTCEGTPWADMGVSVDVKSDNMIETGEIEISISYIAKESVLTPDQL